MLHFETIWNQAESVAKSYTDLDRKEIFRQIRSGVDGLVETWQDSGSIAEYNAALGDVLFGLCALCAHLEEKKGLQLNSAAALTQAIAKKRSELVGESPVPITNVDPSPEDDRANRAKKEYVDKWG